MTLKYASAPPHDVGSRQDWLEKRKALLLKEKALIAQQDEIAAERRALPWVKVDKAYVFETLQGERTLSDLFDGKGQLAVYHFMLAPGSDHICGGCSFLSDHIDAARQHFEHADLAFTAVSRATLARIEEVRRRMGWTFRWVSSNKSDFNFDYGVSFDGRPGETYNFEPATTKGEAHGVSIFAKDDDGAVFHTYSSYARGGEVFIGAFRWLDLTPKGRNEASIMSWVELHDEYPGAEPR
ncbi:MAG: thioredoxin family protein [Hyphomicrobiaceae bacterium]|nr:thioredoxin family protein [Hyphomicrobiaceae bacterium]